MVFIGILCFQGKAKSMKQVVAPELSKASDFIEIDQQRLSSNTKPSMEVDEW